MLQHYEPLSHTEIAETLGIPVGTVKSRATTLGGGGDILVGAGSVWVTDGYNNHVLRLPLAAFQP